MAEAHVTSIEALEAFRARLIVFIAKANQSLDQVGDEIRRTRSWIQHDKRMHWEGEIRRRERVLGQAEQELMSAKMVGLVKDLSPHLLLVRKARHALEQAREKLQKVKVWSRDFDGEAEPLARSLNVLRDYITRDMHSASSYLMQTQKTLEAYGEMSSRPTTKSPSSSSDASPLEVAQPERSELT